jgi:hypothetical protein
MVAQRSRLPNPLPWLATILVFTFFGTAQPAQAESPPAPKLAPAAGPGLTTTGVASTGPGPVDESLSSVRDLRNLGLGIINELNENAWDFNDPDSIPGFASQPYYLRSKPEGLD